MRTLLAGFAFGLLAAVTPASAGTLTVEFELHDPSVNPVPNFSGMMTVRFPVSDIDPLQFSTDGQGGGYLTLVTLSTFGRDNALLVGEARVRFTGIDHFAASAWVLSNYIQGGGQATFLTGPARSMRTQADLDILNFVFPNVGPATGHIDFRGPGTTPDEYNDIGGAGVEVARTFEPAPEAPLGSLLSAVALGAGGWWRWRRRAPR